MEAWTELVVSVFCVALLGVGGWLADNLTFRSQPCLSLDELPFKARFVHGMSVPTPFSIKLGLMAVRHPLITSFTMHFSTSDPLPLPLISDEAKRQDMHMHMPCHA